MCFKIILLVCLTCSVQCSHILGIFHINMNSHFILGNALMKALVKRGHQVTMISPYSQKSQIENYTEIILDQPSKQFLEIQNTVFDVEGKSPIWLLKSAATVLADVLEHSLQNSGVQELLESNLTVDLVITEFAINEAHVGFAEHFNCPLVLMSTLGSSLVTNDYFGNPAPYSYVPMQMLPYTDHMTFFQRVTNTVVSAVYTFILSFVNIPFQNGLMQKYFNTSKRVWDIIHEKAPIILLNSHSSVAAPVPHVPAMIEIGGFHLEEPKPLSRELQEFLDNAEDGAVYFSMGSNIKSSNFPSEKLNAILGVLSKLKQKVLWKWENDSLPEQPPNVMLGKWLPQQDIIAHPNVKLFITHGGLLSTTESVYHGVPFVAIPIFADQKMNVAVAVNSGYGLLIPYQELNEERFWYAINEVLNNPSYTQNVQKRSALIKDQPIPPMEAAIFWIEHVIRHKGAHHLQVGALDLAWYQYFLLDVILFLMIVPLILLLVLYYLGTKICCKRKNVPQNLSKKSN